MADAPILIFDSGLGGLSIYRQLRALSPLYSYLYIADQAHFPYGDKSAAWLATRLKVLAPWFASFHPTLVVLACNTATVNAIQTVREILTVPVVGVEPVVKPLQSYQHPLVLATATTIRTTQSVAQPPVEFYCPPHLATAIELGDEAGIATAIAAIVAYVQTHKFDALGLSCTHYPLVKNELQRALPDLPIIDPSLAVARHARSLLSSEPLGKSGTTRFITTGSVLRLVHGVARYLGEDIGAEQVHI